MKYRFDFVTNSSSSSFIAFFYYTTGEGKQVNLEHADQDYYYHNRDSFSGYYMEEMAKDNLSRYHTFIDMVNKYLNGSGPEEVVFHEQKIHLAEVDTIVLDQGEMLNGETNEPLCFRLNEEMAESNTIGDDVFYIMDKGHTDFMTAKYLSDFGARGNITGYSNHGEFNRKVYSVKDGKTEELNHVLLEDLVFPY